MNPRKNMKTTLLIWITSSAWATCCYAVYPVSDATTQALLQQNGLNEIAKLNDGLVKTQQLISYAEQAKNIAGNPAQALGALVGMTGITSANAMGKTMDQLSDLASNAQNLSSRVQNLYRPLDLQNPLNSLSMKSSNLYAPFQAVEAAYSQYDSQLTKSQATVQNIRAAIDTVNNRVASTEADQRQKQADLVALHAKLADAQKEESDAFHALEAQKILNDSMAEKEDLNEFQGTNLSIQKMLGH